MAKYDLPFIGRKEQLKELEFLTEKNSSSLVVVQGRRRIGKSRLIREFGKKFRHFTFSGLPPSPEVTAQDQRNEFARQMTEQFLLPSFSPKDWGDVFKLLSDLIPEDQWTVLVLDEISWIGSEDRLFLGKLKIAWDLYLNKNPKLILILCGSVSTWIEENILNNTGFFGRISLVLFLKELSILECEEFFEAIHYRHPVSDKFKILGVTGGVPRYLEEIQASLTAEENIKRLCFKKSGILYNEFDRIFSDLFQKRNLVIKTLFGPSWKGHENSTNFANSSKYKKAD